MSHELRLAEVTALGGKEPCPEDQERPHPNPHQAGKMAALNCSSTDFQTETFHNIPSGSWAS